jgi:predicted DNA-binding transcriptional regulator YafY
MQLASRPLLRRLVFLDQRIRSKSFPNARTLGAELEVHPRTIYRDLDFLRDSWGAPIEFCSRRNGYYYRNPDYALPLLRLTEGELLALFVAERVMQHYRGTPYGRDLTTAFEKLAAQLPDTVSLDLTHLQDAYSIRGPDACVGDLERFRRVALAVQENQQLELVYWSASHDETCQRVVDPYHLTLVSGEWYLVAYCHLREEVRMFVPARIRSLRETGERFQRPTDFCIDAYLDGSFRALRGNGRPRRVRLRFTAEAARWVREKQWHPSQRLRSCKDGSLEVSFRLTHLAEVKRWVLSYGSACEVLEPVELRQQVQDELRRTLSGYEK